MLQKKNNGYFMFMFPFLLYFIPKYFEYTTLTLIDGMSFFISILKMLSYVLALYIWMILSLKKRKISFKYMAVIFAIIVYFTYQAFVKNRRNIFVVLLFSLILDVKYIQKFIRDIYKISLILFISTILLCLTGFIENVISDRLKFGKIWTSESLGFEYPGQLTMMLIPIVFMYYYIKKEKIRWIDNMVWILIDMAFFSISKTLMGTFLILLYILLFNFITKKKSIIKKIFWKKWIMYIPIIFFLFTIIILYLCRIGSPVGKFIDFISNYRFNLGNIMIDEYGIKLFGTNFVNSTQYYYQILDSEYMHTLVGEGVIYTVIVLIIEKMILEYACVKDDIYLLLIWIMVFFNAVFNNGIFNLVMNPFGIVFVNAVKIAFTKRGNIDTSKNLQLKNEINI